MHEIIFHIIQNALKFIKIYVIQTQNIIYVILITYSMNI